MSEKLQRVERVNLNHICHYSVFVHTISHNIWGEITLLLQMCFSMFLQVLFCWYMICFGCNLMINLFSDIASAQYHLYFGQVTNVFLHFISKFLKSFLSPFYKDKDDCIKYFSSMSCLYSFTSLEGHGLQISKKEFVDWCCLGIEGTGKWLNQIQSKQQEAVESCVICTAYEVLENQTKDFKMGGLCGWNQRPEKTHTKLNWRM